MYHSTDFGQHWDGTKNGTACQQGAYVYRCRYTTALIPGGWQSATGSVTLVR